MNPKIHLFIDDLKAFSLASMDWCRGESEAASGTIATAVNVLLSDTQRISQMSQESINAVNDLRDAVKALVEEKGGDVKALVDNLQAICRDHNEISSTVEPIIEALQFQDRMTQNLDNLGKMLTCWLEFREKVIDEGVYNDDLEKEFAKQLYDITTMKEERDLIEASFPKGERPPEGTVDSVAFF